MPGATATNRWRGVVAIALVAGSVGLAARRPTILLVAVLGVIFAAYPRLTSVPPIDLELDRRLSPVGGAPGEAVDVEVTVRNDGPRRLWDVRLVDGVPPGLPVVDGTPRHGAVLPPGGSTSFTYVVEARYGRHRFEPATVVARDVSGANEERTTVADETELTCLGAAIDQPALRSTSRDAGQQASGSGGAGVAFVRSRAYRRGDPVNRIDWNRFARRRALTTVLYREERARTVVVLVDAREPAYRGLDGGPDAVSASVAATEQLATALVEARDRVGVAALGWPEAWLGPATGRDHLHAVRLHLATHRAFDHRPPDREPPLADQLDALRARLLDDAQLAVCSPLCDDDVANVVRRLEADGHPVTVYAPDVTSRETPGRRLAAIEREARISDLRRAAIPVVDWVPTVPFPTALAADGRHA